MHGETTRNSAECKARQEKAKSTELFWLGGQVSRGYRMTAITLADDVRNQELDNWEPVGGVIPDALRGFLRHAAGGEAGGLSMMQRSQEQLAGLESQASLLQPL